MLLEARRRDGERRSVSRSQPPIRRICRSSSQRPICPWVPPSMLRAELSRWTPAAAQANNYQVRFSATNPTGQSSSRQVAIDVTSGDPTLATAERPCSPGAVASLTGSWLAEPGSTMSDPTGSAMELGGAKVKVNGVSTPRCSRRRPQKFPSSARLCRRGLSSRWLSRHRPESADF